MPRPGRRARLWCAAACAVVSAFVAVAAASVGDVEWFRTYETIGPGWNTANAVAADSDGHVYVAGSTSGAFPGQTIQPTLDSFVRKYDEGGTEEWTRQFGSVGSDQAFGVAVDVTGVYVVGTVADVLPGQVSAGGPDAFIRKYDLQGHELWTRQFGNTSIDQAQAVTVDSTGVYVAGFFTNTQTPIQQADGFLRKYDLEGTELWDRQLATAGTDRALGVVASASGVFVVGIVGGAFPGQTNAGGGDAFVRSYSPDGTEGWTRQFGTLFTDQALAVSVDGSGAYVAGTASAIVPGQVAGGAFVRKYSFDGVAIWTQQFGSASDQATAISVDTSGVHVAGFVGGTLPGQVSAGQSDAFVRTFDFNGIELWIRQFGTSGADRALGIAATPAGVYTAGTIAGVLPGQEGVGFPDAFLRKYDGVAGSEAWTRQFGTLAAQNEVARAVDGSGGHIYVAGSFGQVVSNQLTVGGGYLQKYDTNGDEVWTRRITTGILASSLQGGALDVAASGSGVYIVGSIFGVLPGQQTTASLSAFIRKYDSDGNEVWTRQFGPTLSRAEGVAVNESGVYVVGVVPLGVLPGQVSAGGGDAFIRKYDANGSELWTRQFGSSSNVSDQAIGVAVDASGVYVAGSVGAALPGQLSAGSTDAFLRKYDHSGAESWTTQFGTSGPDSARAVALDSSGLYVAGAFRAFGSGPQDLSEPNAFVRKYDLSGSEIWTDQFGGPFQDSARVVSVGPFGVYVAGDISSDVPPPNAFTPVDPFVRRYDPSGVLRWSRLIEGADLPEVTILGMSVDLTGLYVAGAASGLTSGSSFVARLADFRPVSIDIKPGEFPNTIRIGSNGSVRVAILSAPDFDATTVDPTTVTLASAPVRLRGNGTLMAQFEDVNGDGRLDLVTHIEIEAVQLSETDSEAVLEGRTFAGERIQGTDTVRTIF